MKESKNTAPSCPHHPEIIATGLCNDCGAHFCTQCLRVYNLATEGERIRLYLCPECFHKRNLKQANFYILAGILVFFFGGIFFLFTPIIGGLTIKAFAIPMIVYGIHKKSVLPKTPSVYVEKETVLARNKVSESALDTDALYGRMLSEYMMRYGAVTAKELLDNEIYAYVRHGLDYNEAVRKVAQAKGITKVETKKEEEPKEMRKSKMIR